MRVTEGSIVPVSTLLIYLRGPVRDSLIVIMACSLTGCALIMPLSMEKQGVKTTRETRRTDLNKKEFKLALTPTPTPTSDGISFHLQYQPYYQEQHRTITTYRWGVKGPGRAIMLGLSIVELVFYFGALYPDELFAGDEYIKEREFFKENQKTILIGVASDALSTLLLSFFYGGTNGLRDPLDIKGGIKTKSTDWKTLPARLDDPINIPNHPVSVSLPQFDKDTTYRTDDNGSFTIPTNDLIDRINEVSKTSDLTSALRTRSIKIDASAKFDKEKAEKSFTIYERSSRPLFQALDKRAKRLQTER